jgi:hypothetical protein
MVTVNLHVGECTSSIKYVIPLARCWDMTIADGLLLTIWPEIMAGVSIWSVMMAMVTMIVTTIT